MRGIVIKTRLSDTEYLFLLRESKKEEIDISKLTRKAFKIAWPAFPLCHKIAGNVKNS